MIDTPYCINCVHIDHASATPLCSHPDALEDAPDYLVTGERASIRPTCRHCREDDTRCGRMGAWFEPKQ